jgi:hypothetical protein
VNPVSTDARTELASPELEAPRAAEPSRAASRQVYREDALPWLRERSPLDGCSLITSLPDVSSFPELDLAGWQRWFVDAAELVLRAAPEQGVAIFYQTDIKRDGVWVDKSYLCHRAAECEGSALLWHKIACRKPAGEPSFGRPAYSHLLCYSRALRPAAAPAYPDVLVSVGAMTWSQAMGIDACRFACSYILTHTQTRTIVDPFCGYGTVLAVANNLGLDAIGVELNAKRARKSQTLQL